MPDETPPRAITPDYDRDPDRFRLARSVLRRHALAPDVHEHVARRFVDERLTPVLDVGCGEGELARHLPPGAWVGVDTSAEMRARAPEPHHLAEATALPFPDERFGSVALLYVLYHLPDPAAALAESRRVLRPGGSSPSRRPAGTTLPSSPTRFPGAATFDAELAPELLAVLFAEAEVEPWDAPLLEPPTRAAVRDYLLGKGVQPQVAESKAEVGHRPALRYEARRTRLRAEAFRVISAAGHGGPDVHPARMRPDHDAGIEEHTPDPGRLRLVR